MEKFDYSDIARTNVKYDGARPWDCQHLQAILRSWLCFPICIGGNFSSVCLRESWERGASPAMYEANKVLCSASKAIWLSMVQLAVMGPCSSDTEGDTTNHFIHWMFYQEIHVELRCSFQDGIVLLFRNSLFPVKR